MHTIVTRGDKLAVTIADGRTSTVVIDPQSSILSRGGRAAVRIAIDQAQRSKPPVEDKG